MYIAVHNEEAFALYFNSFKYFSHRSSRPEIVQYHIFICEIIFHATLIILSKYAIDSFCALPSIFSLLCY